MKCRNIVSALVILMAVDTSLMALPSYQKKVKDRRVYGGAIAISADESRLFIASDGITILDLDSLEITAKLDAGYKGTILHLAPSPDGKILFICFYDRTILFYDLKSNVAIKTFTEEDGGHSAENVAFNRDSSKAISTSRTDDSIKIWDIINIGLTKSITNDWPGEVVFVSDNTAIFRVDGSGIWKLTLNDYEVSNFIKRDLITEFDRLVLFDIDKINHIKKIIQHHRLKLDYIDSADIAGNITAVCIGWELLLYKNSDKKIITELEIGYSTKLCARFNVLYSIERVLLADEGNTVILMQSHRFVTIFKTNLGASHRINFQSFRKFFDIDIQYR